MEKKILQSIILSNSTIERIKKGHQNSPGGKTLNMVTVMSPTTRKGISNISFHQYHSLYFHFNLKNNGVNFSLPSRVFLYGTSVIHLEVTSTEFTQQKSKWYIKDPSNLLGCGMQWRRDLGKDCLCGKGNISLMGGGSP